MQQFQFAQPGLLALIEHPPAGQAVGYVYQNHQWQAVHDSVAAQAQIHGGDAGKITIHAQQGINLSQQSKITTEAVSAGGGAIELHSDGLLQVQDSRITASVQEGEGEGKGGNLNINSTFLIQNQAPIIARAVQGDGGNIQIQSKGIFQFGGASLNPIDASSQFGVSGQVELDTPDEDVNSSVFVVNGQFVQQEIAPFACAPILSLDELSRYRERTHPEAQTRTAEWYQ